MAASSFFALEKTHNPNRFYLPVAENLCVGRQGRKFLFGGVGLAAAIAAMESTTDRRLVWTTAQYLSFARPGEIMDLDVVVPVTGKYNSQARVIAHIGDREILTANAALGAREGEVSLQWAEMPVVPDPEECPPITLWEKRGGLHARMDGRLVKGHYDNMHAPDISGDDGHVMFWIRFKESAHISSDLLAIIADYVPSAMRSALGRDAGANSLDNTLRIRRLVQTEWVLCDIRIHGVHSGFMHGGMLIFSECGELMALASQSGIVRILDE